MAHGHPGQSDDVHRSEQPQRVVPVPPDVSDARPLIDHDHIETAPPEVVRGGEPGVARADDQDISVVRTGHRRNGTSHKPPAYRDSLMPPSGTVR